MSPVPAILPPAGIPSRWPGSSASVLHMLGEGPSKGRSSAELPVEITPVIQHLHATGWAVRLERNKGCPTYLQEET